MFWNENTAHQKHEKCFGIRTQYTKHMRNVLESEYNTPKAGEMFWKCFGIKTQRLKQLRNVLESKHNTSNN